MSACSDFAEHVWKPGSCKNCFHPLSAHRAGSGPTLRRNSQRGDEEGAVTAPSPYSKPTIAVKPTMMNLESNETMTDINMNIEQESPRSPVDRFGLKKLLGLSSLYIDKNGCNKVPRETGLRSPENKMDKCFSLSALSPTKIPKDSVLISNIFVTQEDGQNFRKNDICRQINSTEAARSSKSTYIGNGVKTHYQEHDQASRGMDVSVSSPTKVHNGYESKALVITEATSTSFSTVLNVDTNGSTPLSSQQSPPSPSGSSCSCQSSNGSLSDGFGSKHELGSTQTPTSSLSVSVSPTGPLDKEPIYAESTKKKQRTPDNLKSPTKIKRSPCSPEGSGECQRATITVMAAHTEENNRTFYLSSPDSAVSTQCHFSPSARKDTSSPAFLWPSPSRSAPSLTPETVACLPVVPKPQTSPPIPPKRTNRTPKLGTSSLTSSFSSPVPLPELPKLSASSLTPSASSSVPLPELPMLFLVTSKECHFKVHANNQSLAADRHKSHHHIPGWNCRIEEEEEDEEKNAKEGEKKHSAKHQGTTAQEERPVNGEAANRKEARTCKAQSSPPPITEPGTAPVAATNNGPCQDALHGTGAGEEGKQNGSMPAKQPSHVGSTELLAGGKGAFNCETNPPPPPPKKLHRLCGRMSGSNMELDRCSNAGSVESCASSHRGLGHVSLPTASTDSLADPGSRDVTQLSCSSPFPRSPLPSAPGSPHPNTSDSTNNQPPPLPEKKMVNRTMSAPDSGKQFIRSYPNLLLTGSESPRCQPETTSQSSLPSSPVDPKSMFSSNECLERCHAPLSKPSRSRTLDEPFKRRLGVHCRSSITCSSSPQLSDPLPATELGTGPNVGSTLQLQTLLSNIDSREGVYSKLGGLYAESLRRLALKCEDHFTRSQRNPLRFEESNWSLFRLISNKPSCIGGDSVYYSAACASDPSNSYAVKICKSPFVEAKQGHLYGLSVLQSMPTHFNLQQDCGHFMACVPQSMLPSEEVIKPTASSNAQPMDRERVVVITPDVPQQTAADFVREWGAFHKEQPEVYERRVCFLLLQLCNGLEHLKEHGVTHRDLCLENLLLVPHHRRPPTDSDSNPLAIQRHLPRLLISNFAKAKRRSAEDGAFHSVDPRTKRDHARLAPEIVSAAQYRKFDEFQTGILIYELLHQPNPFEVSPALKEQDYRCEDLPSIPSVSLYSDGLQKLAQLLLQPDPIKRIHIQEAKRILQSLLWGPRKDLMEQQRERHSQGANLMDASIHEGLLNWLDVKRALLMMKFAERSLEPERNAELEDWLCCQYFSSAHPLSLCHTAELLYSLK
ncbi:inactive tyrosine-protein kinase PRAG1 [Periophthalmus magnuspinnatus]|uniref:inactive tyrosine-protein kinase PRAG1 n=1 Tax=Periophthalmus magnuspinnatus TaxID=409849 RepID=UPI00145B79D2|nr:inactive tyrosine-protein kinase PRAG1 [Periophthalmus magnuspinnatus]